MPAASRTPHTPRGDALSVADIDAMRVAIAGVTDRDAERADELDLGGPETALMQLRALEDLKNAISARQADLTVQWADQQRARDAAHNAAVSSQAEAAHCGATATAVLTTNEDLRARRRLQPADTDRVVAGQIALARRTSPHRATRLVRLAHVLVEQLPQTFTAMRAGVITERHANIVAGQTNHLSAADRGQVDGLVRDELGTASERRLENVARDHAYRLDPEGAIRRRAHAETDRYVSLRPAPDTMTWLSALLPVKDGVGVYAALTAAANRPPTDAGDQRGRGQRMADALVEAIIGRTASLAPAADPTDSLKPPVPVAVNLLIPLDTLTGDGPGHLEGYGPIPADLAREFVSDASERLRRLFTYPGTGDLIGMDSTARCYPGLLATFTRLRDQHCRGPYCGAPIRHIDHIRAHATGGPTTERNAQGECAHCNLVKEHPDYTVTGHAGETHTSTGGLEAISRPPAPPGHPPPVDSSLERVLIIRDFNLRIEYDPAA